MSKYTITYACGHTGTEQLYGKHTDRDRKIEWMSRNKLCDECRAAELAKDNAAAAEVNAGNGLVALQGSDKQIAWAESIRSQAIAAIKPKADNFTAHPRLSPAAQQEMLDAVALISAELHQQSAAKWWIDNRDALSDRWLERQIAARAATLCPTAVAESEQAKAQAAAAKSQA